MFISRCDLYESDHIAELEKLFGQKRYADVLSSDNVNYLTHIFLKFYPLISSPELPEKYFVHLYKKIERLCFSQTLSQTHIEKIQRAIFGDPQLTAIAFQPAIVNHTYRVHLHRLTWFNASETFKSWFRRNRHTSSPFEIQVQNFEKFEWINQAIGIRKEIYPDKQYPIAQIREILSLYKHSCELGIFKLQVELVKILTNNFSSLSVEKDHAFLIESYTDLATYEEDLSLTILEKYGLYTERLLEFDKDLAILEFDFQKLEYDCEIFKVIFAHLSQNYYINLSFLADLPAHIWKQRQDFFNLLKGFEFQGKKIQPLYYVNIEKNFATIEEEIETIQRLQEFAPFIVYFNYCLNTYEGSKRSIVDEYHHPIFNALITRANRLKYVKLEDFVGEDFKNHSLNAFLNCSNLVKFNLHSDKAYHLDALSYFFERAYIKEIVSHAQFIKGCEELICHCEHLFITILSFESFLDELSFQTALKKFFLNNPQLKSITFDKAEQFNQFSHLLDPNLFGFEVPSRETFRNSLRSYQNPIRLMRQLGQPSKRKRAASASDTLEEAELELRIKRLKITPDDNNKIDMSIP